MVRRKYIRRKNKGVTLIEVLLVLAVAASILILSVKQYQSMSLDANVQQVQANVDTLFQSMSYYYKANCRGLYRSDQTLIPGSLNAFSNTTYPKTINIRTDLVTPGYLVTPLTSTTVLPLNPLVDASAGGTYGYVVQFNLTNSPGRYICISSSGSTGPYTPGCLPANQNARIGAVWVWQAQVAVALTATSQAQALMYLQLLNGDCLSTLQGSTVAPCDGSNQGNYVVWSRLPTMASPSSVSNFWQTNHVVTKFNEMYTTYPVTYLIERDGQTNNSYTQYFNCGG